MTKHQRTQAGSIVCLFLATLVAGCGSGVSTTSQTPGLSLSATTLTFANTIQNTTATAQTVTLTNSGNGTLTVGTIASSSGVFAISSNSCGATLSSGAQCALSVTFTPSGAAAYTGTISITDNAAGSPQTIALSGTGVVTPSVTFTPSSLAFPNTADGTAATPMTAVVTNNGMAPLSLSSVGLTSGTASAFTVTSTTCSGSLAAGGTCSVTIGFSPATAGSFTGAFSISDGGVGSPQMLPLSGAGGVAALSVTPSSLAFGTDLVGSTAQLPVTLKNTSTFPATFTSAVLTGNTSGVYSLGPNSCTSPIAAGASCSVSVNFNPTAVTSSTASLVLTDSGPASPQTIPLTGAGAVEPNSCTTTKTTSPAQPAPTANYAGTAFSGKVMAGTTPIIGASVQIYAAGQTGNGSIPTPLLTTPLITGTTGAFSVPASFTCPYNNSVLYAVARGGQAGSTGAINPGTVLTSVLGLCNSISGAPTFVINEVTTAGTVWSMQQFLSLGGKMGATATNSSGIVLAAGTFANLVNNLVGTSPGTYFPANGTAPSGKINQVANLLNACIVSSGATSNACTQLYALTTTTAGLPTNTLDAALNLVRNPAANVGALYTLSAGSTAFSPVLAAAPADWTLYVNFTGGGMNDPSALSIDSTGKVWVASYVQIASLFSNTGTPVFPNGEDLNYLFNSYGGGVDVNDMAWIVNEESAGFINGGLGSVTVLNNSGGSSAIYTAGGIYFPLGIAFDTQATTWIVDYGDSSLTLLNNSGTPLSGGSGYSIYQYGFPVAVATDAKCNAWIANQATNEMTFTSASGTIFGSYIVGGGPSGIAVDAPGNVWTANYYGNSVGLLAANGTVLSGAGGFTGGGLDRPQGIAADGAGNIWVANFRAPGVTEIAGTATTSPGAALSPTAGYASDAGLLESFALAIDASGNIWISNFATNTLTELVGLAAPVKTPLLGPVRVP